MAAEVCPGRQNGLALGRTPAKQSVKFVGCLAYFNDFETKRGTHPAQRLYGAVSLFDLPPARLHLTSRGRSFCWDELRRLTWIV
jgi:hypothetical protein